MMHSPDSSPTQHGQQRFVIEAGAEEVGQRLDRFLTDRLDGRSRSSIQQSISEGHVLVNGRPSKAGYLLRAGDDIHVAPVTPVSHASTLTPQALPLDIIYEDEDLLVINKAAGMVVHPAPGHSDDTLVNALLAHYPALQDIESAQRPGIVHRLDRDTSGLILVAKNAHTQAALAEQMRQHQVQKRYIALVEGVVGLDAGSIDAPIGRDRRNRQQMAITALGSRAAITHFRVLERFARHTLLLLQLETGRTHQIRVHLKAIGHPVVGDPTYGASNTIRGVKLKRQFLHASQMQFTHPTTGKPMEFEAPLPPDLQQVLDQKSFL